MLEWWHWIILGLVLTLAELAVPAFFIVWFGLGALGIGLVLLAWPGLSLAAQLVLWAALAAALTAFWFRYLKPRTVSQVGSSSAALIGEIGVLVGELTPQSRGQVRFQKPLLGADLWACYAESPLAAGTRVRVVAVEGSFLKVESAQ